MTGGEDIEEGIPGAVNLTPKWRDTEQ
jgi:hypothetical protein